MIPLGILLFLLLVFIVLFYGLQRYIVYGQDGVYLDFSGQGQAQSDGMGPSSVDYGVVAEIVYDEADYSEIQTTAGEDLSPVKALYLSAEQVTAETLGSISAQLSSIGANALVLEMKGTQGTLGWYSSVPLASSYGTNGTLDIASAVAPLKEEGIWLVARISCCIDEYMAIRNAPLALATAAGTVYSDTAGIWLDPSNTDVRQYTADLAAELLSLGFDEVLLSDLYVPQPTDGTELVFSQVGSVELTPDIIMSGYALTVRDAVEAAGGKLSVVCDANAWRGGATDSNGQDPELFSRVFDRLYWLTDGNTVTSDMQIVGQAISQDQLASRFVPIMYNTSTTESWAYPYG